MTAVETIAHAGNGTRVDQLLCHPRLPLVAGLDARRPAVHVWDHGSAGLLAVGIIGGDSRAYGDGHYLALRNPEIAVISDRRERRPAVAWHPDQPLLIVASEGTVTRWTPEGISAMDGLPTGSAYSDLAFSPDGQSLWASPSPAAKESPYQHCSDAIHLTSGAIRTGRGWDTGVAIHPGGGLIATLRNDQGETHVIFARVDPKDAPAAMRVLMPGRATDLPSWWAPLTSQQGVAA